MTAGNVITLPVVRIDRQSDGVDLHVVRVPIIGKDLSRLRDLAKHWNMPIEDAASALLNHALGPQRRRRT